MKSIKAQIAAARSYKVQTLNFEIESSKNEQQTGEDSGSEPKSKDSKQEDFISIAISQDKEQYDEKKGHNVVYDRDAIRVEQGEYAVTNDPSKRIGTHNINQCLVVCAYNQEKKIHGMVHIDGRSEAASLKHFFELMGGSAGPIKLRLFGASGDIVEPDNKISNLDKFQKFITESKQNIEIISKNIGDDHKNPEILMDSAQNIYKGFAGGGATYERALHNLQQLKRSVGTNAAGKLDHYYGSYRLQEGFSGQGSKEVIYLDVHDLKNIALYKEHHAEIKGARNEFDGTKYEEFDSAVQKIIAAHEAAVTELSNSFKLDSSKQDQLHEILKQIPIYIGKGSAEYNKPLAEFITAKLSAKGSRSDASLNLDKAELNKVAKRMAPGGPKLIPKVWEARNLVMKLDTTIDAKELITRLMEEHNARHAGKQQLNPLEQSDRNAIINMAYGSEVDPRDFTIAVNKVSKKLATSYALSSYNSSKTLSEILDLVVGESGIKDSKDAIISKLVEFKNQQIAAKYPSSREDLEKFEYSAEITHDDFRKIVKRLQPQQISLAADEKFELRAESNISVEQDLRHLSIILRGNESKDKIIEQVVDKFLDKCLDTMNRKKFTESSLGKMPFHQSFAKQDFLGIIKTHCLGSSTSAEKFKEAIKIIDHLASPKGEFTDYTIAKQIAAAPNRDLPDEKTKTPAKSQEVNYKELAVRIRKILEQQDSERPQYMRNTESSLNNAVAGIVTAYNLKNKKDNGFRR